jgi:PhzF family phenazine biosynthesis protein
MAGTPIWIIDAFTDRAFAGNPAAVCLLASEQESGWMQAVAAEMNLSETAFVRPLAEGFQLRWFTPLCEVKLCGHATLASAHALWESGAVGDEQAIRFHTASGVLTATHARERIELDFPATPARACDARPGLLEALGAQPNWVGQTEFDTLLLLESADTLRRMQPDFRRLATIETRGVIVTAASDDARFDFLSRFFAPAVGINEDPVTGSAHCALAPFWAERLGKREMTAFQASPRGGVVHVRVLGERVILGGQAVTILKGELQA